MSANKVRYPGPGCLVEFMQGNSPMQALVLEAKGDRLRLYGINHRETTLQAGRLLPWSGPDLGTGLSRQRMDELLEERRALRVSLADDISSLEVWELTQGEMAKAPAEWLAGLIWEQPGIDQEAALGHVLLAAKTHFRFSPPDFEIFPQDVVEARQAQAEAARIRESFAITGAQFFQKLWGISTRKRGTLTPQEEPDAELAEKLKAMLFTRLADPESLEDAPLWQLLIKGLPDSPHIALILAVAWRLIPEHYNFWLDRIGFERGDAWAESLYSSCPDVRESVASLLPNLERDASPFVSVDPACAEDRDDALCVERLPDAYRVKVALACPACVWPFGSELDKAVMRRASSLYFPEGNQHMLPASIGRNLFSLDAGALRPALVVSIQLSPQGEMECVEPRLAAVTPAANLALEDCEAALGGGTPAAESCPSLLTETALPSCAAMLRTGLELAGILQQRRIANGAVITEQPDPEIRIEGLDEDARVHIDSGPDAALSHLLVSEIMILVNSALAKWGRDRGLPLLYRTQDVALPREFSGIWSEPHDIFRVMRALPPALPDMEPRRHAGLGVDAYATMSSPLRRYVDLWNQGQVAGFLLDGVPPRNLAALLPVLSARADAVNQAQRARPRYWKLLFFRQRGDRHWWEAVVVDENEAFATVSLPWAQILVRGRRRSFDEKIYPGMPVQVRLGKVDPLMNEIQVLEAREA